VSLPLHRKALIAAAAAVGSACLPTRACVSLPGRPAALEHAGVRVGDRWLAIDVLYDDARLGSITQIVKRANGELAIVGAKAAIFLPGAGGTAAARAVRFAEPAGHPELVEWPDGQPRFVDRGGGGWQTGALIDVDGRRLWQPERRDGMDDLAAGDVDGDGLPEFVVGYNGGQGVHLLDATGKARWAETDSNVWHVDIVDTDGDGKAEIIHSNAAGQLTVRDARGKVLRRAGLSVSGYLSDFSLVRWPPPEAGVLHSGDGATEILGFDGKVRASLVTPDSPSLGEASGVAARFGADDYLVLALSARSWDRTQLFVFDKGGALRYREVVVGNCRAVAAPEPDAFLFGCGTRVWRYKNRP